VPPETLSNKQQIKKFLDAAMVYPKEDLAKRIDGKVKLSFTIDEEGYPVDVEIISGQTAGLNDEAVRLASRILWKPALKNGKAVKTVQTFTIDFNCSHYYRVVKERGYGEIEFYDIPFDKNKNIYNFADLDETPKPIIKKRFINLGHYIQEMLQYPESAFRAGIQGTVKLKFVIENDGIVSNIRVDKSVGGGCDNEAIRILQSIQWKPGIKNQLAIRSHASMDVTFQISSNKIQGIPNRQSTGL
jgi:TonB family protein